MKKFRDLGAEGEIGFAPNTTWLEPFSDRQEDIDACNREIGWYVEWFMDPIFKGEYPKFLVDWFEKKGVSLDIQDGDMEAIQQPIDFLGINYYTGHIARYKENHGLLDWEFIEMNDERTDIGWPIFPEGLYKVLMRIKNNYNNPPVYITENGACYNDEPENGRVKDDGRINYLQQHLTALRRAISSDVDVKGYITWSLMDNFEWAEGYTMRFGIVHVNYRTLERTKKDSFYWYKQTVANHWFEN